MNQRFLLDWLYTNGPATRPQLARDSGLSQPTVFATLANLEKVGLVRPMGQSDEPSGRPALVYEADPTAGAVVAVDLGYERVRVVVADLTGKELSRIEVRNSARSAKAMVDMVFDATSSCTSMAGLALTDVTCAIIASPGVYKEQHGRIAYAPLMPGWQRPKLADALRERLIAPLTIENDVNLAALGEYTEGVGRGVSPFAYLHIGTGVGLGLVIDGQLYRGFSGAAGEIGFLPMMDRPGGAPRDRARGMLEEALAAEAVVGYAKEAGMKGAITAEKVYREARTGGIAARAAVKQQTEVLARLLASLCAILDPELIVMGGGIGHNLDLLGVGLSDRLAEITPLKPRLAVSALGSEATVRGAVVRGIAIAREAEFVSRFEAVEPAAEEIVKIS
jgi:predicted NBD/HSP70 family sugar kinase